MILANEAEARDWLTGALGVSRETLVQLDRFAALLRAANATQNLIAASTAGDALWTRHIADSAQLVPHALDAPGDWIDVGSGPGLPGLVVALLEPERRIVLLESRRLRCEFLRHCCAELGLTGRVDVAETTLARFAPAAFAVVSARAFAPLPRLLAETAHISGPGTLWLLPKGRNAVKELFTLSPAWQKRFHVERSLTDADAAILVGNGVPQATRTAAGTAANKGKTRR